MEANLQEAPTELAEGRAKVARGVGKSSRIPFLLNVPLTDYKDALIFSVLLSSRLLQCRSDAHMHRSGSGIKFTGTFTTNLVRDCLELCLYHNHMCLDFGASQCSPAKFVEGPLV